MSHYTLSIRPSRGGVRRFAVAATGPVARADWSDDLDIWSQSDQTWVARVWERIGGRGYVCRLDGGGQWADRGDHGTYIGTGPTAEAALLDAWGRRDDGDLGYDGPPPRSLVAPMRDHDAEAKPPAVE